MSDYDFRDLNIYTGTEDTTYPSEAMNFNGKYFENEIPGYRTLQVTGRELVGNTLSTLKVGNQDGKRLQMLSRPSREITVKYQLDAESNDAFRQAFYKLNMLLAGRDGKFFFHDDTTKYYVGTLEDVDDADGGSNSIVSTFTILCNDPYAYDMREDEFEFSDTAQTVSLSLDYRTKIQGDLASNPNMIYGAEWHAIENRAPDSFWWEWEQYNYNQVQMLDGITGSYQRTAIDNSTRLMMKFNVLESINNSYPGIWQRYGVIDVADKIAWLKANLTKFTFNVWSYGQGASGYGVKVQYWNGTEWTGTQANTASKPAKNSYSFTAAEVASYLDADGYFYTLSGTNDTDANTASTMYLDYTNIDVTLTLPVSDALVVTNDGPLPVPIRFELTNHGDNGFFGITNDTESILIGKPSDIDGGFVENSERLFTTNQNNSNGLKQWTINEGVLNDWNEEAVQSGTFEDPSVIKESRWRLRNEQDMQTAWGNGAADGRGWHGPSATAKFAKDSKGATGALNFTARFYVQYLFGNMNQSALQQCNLAGPDGELLVSVQMWKDVGKHSGFSIRIGDQSAWTDNNNARWDNFFGSILIKRHGNQYTIELENIEGSGPKTRQTITYDDADSAKIPATQVTYWKSKWGNATNYNNVMYNDLYDFWFQKDNVDTYVDIPNAFSELDTVVVDGSNRKVTTKVNGTLNLGLQDVGSQPVLAYPGKNMINIMFSDFANAPDVKAYIRKRYL